MITAEEARSISEQSLKATLQKELELVEQRIKQVSSGGHTYVLVDDLSAECIKELESLGYTATRYFKFANDPDSAYYRIDW